MDKERRTSDQTDDFDIVDFDLNEYDEEFEKEEQKLQLKPLRYYCRIPHPKYSWFAVQRHLCKQQE